MASLELHHVFKVYPNGVKAVNDFVLDAPDKEFIVFVGPSGCGKSTTLRMIAGLEDITTGDIKIDGQIVNDSDPKERDIAMVFQNYALYPHMTVYKNMAFGLRLRHVPKNEIDKRVREAAEILGLTDYLKRKPKEMSGGQRQRVALGRAIVREPKIFLLDEPLSNLDAKLRASMRSEISKLHKKLGTTFVYVTHDQVEAMTLGTKVVVMKEGFVQQIDSPINLYKYPTNKFVAGFIGTPQMNFFNGTLKKDDKGIIMKIANTNISYTLPKELLAKVDERYLDGNKELIFGIRSEHISVEKGKYYYNAKVRVNFLEELGVDSQIYTSFNLEENDIISDNKEEQLIIKCSNNTHFENGEIIDIYFDFNQLHVFDKENENSVNPRLPEMMSTKGNVEGKDINLYGSKIHLPNAVALLDGIYNIDIPTSALTLGEQIEAKIISVEKINNQFLVVLEKENSYLYLSIEEEIKAKVGDLISLNIDFKQCKFVGANLNLEPLQTHSVFTVEVEKTPTKVQHFDKNDQPYERKEYICYLKIDGVNYGTDASLGLKLLNLKEKKIFKGPIDMRISCYNMKLTNEKGIKGKIIDILDYGKERFAKVEITSNIKGEEIKQIIIVLCDKNTKLGETFIELNVNKGKFYSKKNSFRLV